MSFITALFALGIALATIGSVVTLASSISMLAPYDPEEEEKGTRMFKMSVIAVIVGAFIIGLTAQGATA